MPSAISVEPGQRFGRLTVLGFASHIDGRRAVKLKCDCGTVCVKKLIVLTKSNATRSCGCLKIEELVARSRTHGMSKTPTYGVWTDMRKRCENPASKSYPDYGERGIKVCKRWLKFENFLSDMGKRPSPRHEITRKDNDGGYEPSNCRWSASARQQNINRRGMGTASQFRGVDLNRGRWRARFNVRNKGARHLGLFDTEEDAARAYDAVARLHRGFILNFPDKET
jgi:hypothetical protein